MVFLENDCREKRINWGETLGSPGFLRHLQSEEGEAQTQCGTFPRWSPQACVHWVSQQKDKCEVWSLCRRGLLFCFAAVVGFVFLWKCAFIFVSFPQDLFAVGMSTRSGRNTSRSMTNPITFGAYIVVEHVPVLICPG